MPWNNIRNRKVALGLGAAFMAVTVRSSMFTVEGGQRAVLFDRFNGVLEEPIGEGTYRKIPWVQKPYIFNIRSIAWRLGSNCGTKDLQMVNLSLRVMCRPVVSRLPYIYQNLGHNYAEKVLPAIGPDVLKAVVAQFNADELLTKLPQVSALIRETLIKRTGVFNIIIDDVSITDLSYSKEFLSAVEWKQVAQQEAELSKFLVAKADQERRAAVIRAEGESESARVFIESYRRCGNGVDRA